MFNYETLRVEQSGTKMSLFLNKMVHSLNSFSSFLSITVLHFTKNNRKEVRTIGKLEGIRRQYTKRKKEAKRTSNKKRKKDSQ